MKIVLLGYMASGKSTVGKQLSKKLSVQFLDLDDYISEKEQMSITEIFDKKGEVYFRLIENKYLKASFLSRLGSGSASRSLYGPAAIWGEHKNIPSTSDQYAIAYHDLHENFKNYVLCNYRPFYNNFTIYKPQSPVWIKSKKNRKRILFWL